MDKEILPEQKTGAGAGMRRLLCVSMRLASAPVFGAGG